MQQRFLLVAVAIASLVLGGLLVRRALRSGELGAASAPASQPSAELFSYRGAPTLEDAPTDAAEPGPLALTVSEIEGACEGDAASLDAMRARIGERWASAAPEEVVREQVAALPEQCFEPPSPPGMCAWAASEIDQGGALSGAAWTLLTRCPTDVAAPFFDRGAAPAEEVVAFVARRRVGPGGWGPPRRLPSMYTRAVLELAARAGLDADRLFGAGAAVARYEDPAADALVDAYVAATEAGPRRLLLRSLGSLSNERAVQALRGACSSDPTFPECTGATPGTPLELLVAPVAYALRHAAERAQVEDALERCVRGEDTTVVGIPSRCLGWLGELDRARARTLASTLDTHADAALAAVARALTQYPSSADLVLSLRSRGLLGTPRGPEGEDVTVVATMARYGRAWRFEPMSAADGAHDRLARHLLRLGGIDDVEVSERPRAPSGGSGLLGRVTELRAHVHGETYATETHGDGDFYDLDALVGLLNLVARVRGSATRYLVVADPLAEEAVALGPASALSEAVAEGLLEAPAALAPPSMPPF